MSNPLEQVQTDIFNRIKAAPYFADKGVFLIRARANLGLTAIQEQVDNYLAGLKLVGGKQGIAVLVQMPSGDTIDPNVPGPRLKFSFQVRVIERPMENMNAATGTLAPAEEVCLEVLQLIHQFKPNRSFTLVAASPAMVPTDDGGAMRIVYDVRFEQLTGLARPVKCAIPEIVRGASGFPTTVTVNTTGGASARYSLDGSYPTLVYASPLDIASACTFRALSSLAGSQESDVVDLEIS